MNLNETLKKFTTSKYFKAISVLTIGSVLAQLITLISYPLITRIYDPAIIGVFAYVVSISNIFRAVINGRYDMSIITEKEENKALYLIKLSFIITCILTIIITFLYFLYFNFFSQKETSYEEYALYLLFILLAYGIINLLTAYNNRKKEYKKIVVSNIARTSTQNFGSIFLGLITPNVFGLLFPFTIGLFASIRYQAKSLLNRKKDLFHISKKNIKSVAREHYKFPLFSAPALFVNSLSYSIITIMIEALYDTETLGYYSVSTKILGIPLSIIGGSISKVFLESASKEFHFKGNFKTSFSKTFLFLLALGIPLFIGMFFIIPSIAGFILGQRYAESGEYIKVLAIFFSVRFIVSPLSVGFLIMGKQSVDFMLQLLLIVAASISYVIASVNSYNIIAFLKAVTYSKTIVFIVFFLFLVYAVYKRNSNKINDSEVKA